MEKDLDKLIVEIKKKRSLFNSLKKVMPDYVLNFKGETDYEICCEFDFVTNSDRNLESVKKKDKVFINKLVNLFIPTTVIQIKNFSTEISLPENKVYMYYFQYILCDSMEFEDCMLVTEKLKDHATDEYKQVSKYIANFID